MLTRRTEPPSTWLNLHTSLGRGDLMCRGEARSDDPSRAAGGWAPLGVPKSALMIFIIGSLSAVNNTPKVVTNQVRLEQSIHFCWQLRSPGAGAPPKLPGSSTGLRIWKYYQESVTHLWRKRQTDCTGAFVLFMEFSSHSEQVWELTLSQPGPAWGLVLKGRSLPHSWMEFWDFLKNL